MTGATFAIVERHRLTAAVDRRLLHVGWPIMADLGAVAGVVVTVEPGAEDLLAFVARVALEVVDADELLRRETPDGAFPYAGRRGVVDLVDLPVVRRAPVQAADAVGRSRHRIDQGRAVRHGAAVGTEMNLVCGGLAPGLPAQSRIQSHAPGAVTRIGISATVRLHVKPHPTYVSDATIKDVRATLDYFEADTDSQVQALGSRLSDYWLQGRLQVRENFFWTSPLPGWELPLPVEMELSQSSLVISKGDANYRRLLGDLDWPSTTPFTDILAYFPTSIVALRTVKAEITCGLQSGQVESVAAKDPDWMIDGRWGLLQFFESGRKWT